MIIFNMNIARRWILAVALAAATGSASALTAQNDGVITVRTSKASRPLVERWIAAYSEVHPDTKIELVTGKGVEADLVLTNHKTDNQDGHVTYVGRYALLPVTSAENPLKEDIERRVWSAKDLKKLFFVNEEEEDFEDIKTRKEKLGEKLTVYTGTHSKGWTPVVAAHFGRTTEELKGQKVAGDDVFLLQALADNPEGVAFAAVPCLYDRTSRHLRTELALLPLGVKREQSEVLREGTLDEVLQVLEGGTFDAIPTEQVGFIYKTFDRDIDHFLAWVLSDGQQYLAEQGFLRLEEGVVRQELVALNGK